MKQNVAVVFGGRSTEHDVSIITGLVGVIAPLKLTKSYHPIPVYVAKDGRWYSEPQLSDINFYRTGDIQKKLSKFKPLELLFDDGLKLVKSGIKPKKQKIDILFPAMHGTYGEDGSLMGIARMANVPFVGSNLAESAIAMDKYLSRMITSAAGIPNPEFLWFRGFDYQQNPKAALKKINETLEYPLFVKPTHMGSSIGVSKVQSQQELENAIEVALHYDNAVIVEEAVKNLIEVTVPIMGNYQYELGLVEEILSKGEDFFDFNAKYMSQGKGGKKVSAGQGGSKYSRIPAKLPKALYQQCEQTVKDVFYSLGASGYARVDLLIDSKAKKVYFNEINPLPGTLQRHNWKEAGVSPVQLVEKLIGYALERHQDENKRQTTFDSSFLSQF